MDTKITDLPPELILRIVGYLPALDIGQLSQTCQQLCDLCNSEIVWQKLCHSICDSKRLDEWEASFYDIYTKVFHKYKRCIGLWRRKMEPYGGLFQVKVDSGRLLGTEYKPPIETDIQGPLRPKNVFSIGINKSTNETEILCLRGYQGPHPGSVESDPESGDIIFKCCRMSCHDHPQGSLAAFEEIVKEETDNYSLPFTSYDKDRIQCYISNAQTYVLTPIHIQPHHPSYPIQPGLFAAHYSAHGIEMFLLTYDMEKKEAHVVKLTGDPNVPSGETSIYVNLRKPLNLTKDQQSDVDYIMSLTPEDVPDVDEIQPLKQDFVIPPHFQTFTTDFDMTSCQYRCFGDGSVANVGYINPRTELVHVVLHPNVFIVMWLCWRECDVFNPLKLGGFDQ